MLGDQKYLGLFQTKKWISVCSVRPDLFFVLMLGEPSLPLSCFSKKIPPTAVPLLASLDWIFLPVSEALAQVAVQNTDQNLCLISSFRSFLLLCSTRSMTLRRGSLSLCCCTSARPYSTPTACSSPNRYSALWGLSEPPRVCWEGGQIVITKGYHFFLIVQLVFNLSGGKSSLNFSPNVRPWKYLGK